MTLSEPTHTTSDHWSSHFCPAYLNEQWFGGFIWGFPSPPYLKMKPYWGRGNALLVSPFCLECIPLSQILKASELVSSEKKPAEKMLRKSLDDQGFYPLSPMRSLQKMKAGGGGTVVSEASKGFLLVFWKEACQSSCTRMTELSILRWPPYH